MQINLFFFQPSHIPVEPPWSKPLQKKILALCLLVSNILHSPVQPRTLTTSREMLGKCSVPQLLRR